MSAEEARQLLVKVLRGWRKRSFERLTKRVNREATQGILRGSFGTEYHITIRVYVEDHQDLLIVGWISSAKHDLRPVCECIRKSTDGYFERAPYGKWMDLLLSIDRDLAREQNQAQQAKLMDRLLEHWYRLNYDQLVARIDRPSVTGEIFGPDGMPYQFEIIVVWDDIRRGTVQVLATIEGGDIRAYSTLYDGLIMTREGRYLK